MAKKKPEKKPAVVVAVDPVLGVVAVPKEEALGKMWVTPEDTLRPAMTSDPGYYAASLLLAMIPISGIFYTLLGADFPHFPRFYLAFTWILAEVSVAFCRVHKRD